MNPNLKDEEMYKNNATIVITMYLKPIIWSDSPFILDGVKEVAASVSYAPGDKKHPYHTDVNPVRIINGSLSKFGEQLESPIKEEWEHFIEDCKFLVTEVGFTIIESKLSESSEKSEYILCFGMDNKSCGTIVFDLRISDHPFDATFPDKWKTAALEYLKMNKVLDDKAAEAGIDFVVEKVIIGNVYNDSWGRAFDRLYDKLRSMKRKDGKRLKRDNNR